MAASAVRSGPGATPSLAPLAPTPATVVSRVAETNDTVTLSLRGPSGTTFPAARPGQFNMVYAFGVGEVAVSLSGHTGTGPEIVHTIRSVGPVSTAIARSLPGTTVGVRGPYGRGWPVEEALRKDVVVLAGGLGLAPLRPLLYELISHRERYGRLEIVYGARTPKDLLYAPLLAEWRARSDLRCQVTVDAAGEEWYGDVGVVTTRLPDARFDPRHAVAFVCGPEIMMKVAVRALLDRGVAAESIWLSMERNMKCAVGYCGHCQLGPAFVCRDGPVFPYSMLRPFLGVKEL